MRDAPFPKRYVLLFLAFCVAVFVSTFNSFGLSTLQDVDIARRLSALTSVIYDPGAAPRRDNIVVVVFDDDAVDALSADPNDRDRPLRTLGPSYADQRAVIAAAHAAGADANPDEKAKSPSLGVNLGALKKLRGDGESNDKATADDAGKPAAAKDPK